MLLHIPLTALVSTVHKSPDAMGMATHKQDTSSRFANCKGRSLYMCMCMSASNTRQAQRHAQICACLSVYQKFCEQL